MRRLVGSTGERLPSGVAAGATLLLGENVSVGRKLIANGAPRVVGDAGAAIPGGGDFATRLTMLLQVATSQPRPVIGLWMVAGGVIALVGQRIVAVAWSKNFPAEHKSAGEPNGPTNTTVEVNPQPPKLVIDKTDNKGPDPLPTVVVPFDTTSEKGNQKNDQKPAVGSAETRPQDHHNQPGVPQRHDTIHSSSWSATQIVKFVAGAIGALGCVKGSKALLATPAVGIIRVVGQRGCPDELLVQVWSIVKDNALTEFVVEVVSSDRAASSSPAATDGGARATHAMPRHDALNVFTRVRTWLVGSKGAAASDRSLPVFTINVVPTQEYRGRPDPAECRETSSTVFIELCCAPYGYCQRVMNCDSGTVNPKGRHTVLTVQQVLEKARRYSMITTATATQ